MTGFDLPYTPYVIAVIAVALSGFLTLAICRRAMPIGRSLGLLDDPRRKEHCLHNEVVPLVGGIAVFLPLLLLSGLTAILVETGIIGHSWAAPYVLGSGMLIITILGLIDDRIQLSAKLRLWAMIALFTGLSIMEPDMVIRSIDLAPLWGQVHLGALGLPFTVLCLTALVNAVNMADGRNGLVLGMALIWCVALQAYPLTMPPLRMMAIATSLAIVFAYNVRGKLFLGDAGAYGVSFIAGAYVLYLHNVGPINLSGTVGPALTLSSTQSACLFIIPILDMARVMGTRLAQGHPVMSPNHDHLHHRLERHVGWTRGLPLYLALVATPIAISQWQPTSGMLGIWAGVLLYGATWLVTRDKAATTPEILRSKRVE